MLGYSMIFNDGNTIVETYFNGQKGIKYSRCFPEQTAMLKEAITLWMRSGVFCSCYCRITHRILHNCEY